MEYSYKHIIANATTTVCSRPCILHSITLNENTTDTITIKDGTNEIAIIATEADYTPQTLTYDVICKTSLIVVTAGSDDITVSYRPTAA